MGDISFSISRFFGEESPLITVLKQVVELLRVIVAQQAALVSKK